MQGSSRRIVVGRIAGIYGTRGWFKVISYTSPRENILGYNPWLLKIKDVWREAVVRDWKMQNRALTVALEGIDDRETAGTLIGTDIAVLRSQLQELPRGEYYQADLVDMQVINQKGRHLGRVKEIMSTGANDVLVIEGAGRHLIPLVWRHYVLEIDPDAGIIRVDWEETD